MRPETLLLHAGVPKPDQGGPFLPGPVFAAPFHAAGDPAQSNYTYGRFHHPTWTNYENALSALEGGSAIAFASGMAAVSAVLGSVLRPGDAVLMPADSYYSARVLAQGFFAEMGVKTILAPTAGNAQKSQVAGAKLVWLETPSNPTLEVCDIAAISAAAHEAGALVAVDNTTPTVLGQQPLALGADFSVASDTKGLCGHSDLIMGHVAVRDPKLLEGLRTWRTQIGAIPGPMETWLAHRSLATLDVRLTRQCLNTLALAEFLTQREEIATVRYPGLRRDPSHAIAAKQMHYFGSVVSFVLPNKTHAERFLSACNLVYEATSFGGVHTTAERRARWGGDKIPEGFIRMNAGCEALEDLLEDLAQALEAART